MYVAEIRLEDEMMFAHLNPRLKLVVWALYLLSIVYADWFVTELVLYSSVRLDDSVNVLTTKSMKELVNFVRNDCA